MHYDEKPHVCAECGRAFKRGSYLIQHLRIHTGEKPYKCTECDRAFLRTNNPKTHMLIHTGESLIYVENVGKRLNNTVSSNRI